MSLEALQRNAWAVSPLATMIRFGPPDTQAPAHLRAISNQVVDSFSGKGPKNACFSAPPRHAKSTLLSVYTSLWALAQDPSKTVVLLCYGDDLAISLSRQVRDLVKENEEVLGFGVAEDSRAVDRWSTTYGGGMLARGILSGVTGFGASACLLCDDMVRSSEATTPAALDQIWSLYQSVARTRIQQGAPCFVYMTRWSPSDIVGR